MDTSFFNSLFKKYIKNKPKNFERRKTLEKIEAAFKYKCSKELIFLKTYLVEKNALKP